MSDYSIEDVPRTNTVYTNSGGTCQVGSARSPHDHSKLVGVLKFTDDLNTNYVVLLDQEDIAQLHFGCDQIIGITRAEADRIVAELNSREEDGSS